MSEAEPQHTIQSRAVCSICFLCVWEWRIKHYWKQKTSSLISYLQKLCSAGKHSSSYLCYLYLNLEVYYVLLSLLWINVPFLSRRSPLKCAMVTGPDLISVWVDNLSLTHRSPSSAATQPQTLSFFVPLMTVGILPSALQRNYRGWKEQKGQWRKLGLDGEEPLRPAVWGSQSSQWE